MKKNIFGSEIEVCNGCRYCRPLQGKCSLSKKSLNTITNGNGFVYVIRPLTDKNCIEHTEEKTNVQ